MAFYSFQTYSASEVASFKISLAACKCLDTEDPRPPEVGVEVGTQVGVGAGMGVGGGMVAGRETLDRFVEK